MKESAITDELKDMAHPAIYLLVVSTSDYLDASIQSVAALTKKMPGVYVTVNRPYSKLVQVFKKNGVDVSKILFIDAITQVAVPDIEDEATCMYIPHPSDMTQLGIAVTEALKAIQGEKFLLVDSISTLLAYNPKDVVTSFLHSLSTKLATMDASAIFLSLAGETDKMVEDVVCQFCDKVIRPK